MKKFIPLVFFAVFLGCSLEKNNSKPESKTKIVGIITTLDSNRFVFADSERIGDHFWILDSNGYRKYYQDSMIEFDPFGNGYPGTQDSLRIDFLNGFNYNRVKLWIDDNPVFEGLLKKEFIGPSESIRVKKGNNLKIQINNSIPVSTQLKKKYDQIIIRRRKEVLLFKYTNNHVVYN